MLAVLCLMAIAYRYYSAFLAAKVATLDDTRITPAHQFHDGQNFHPTSKWVLFGHHFAAISGAGPLIGPVLAAQFGYLPGMLWIVIGVCLAGAAQDFLVLAASIRRNGKSLAQIAFTEIGPVAGWAATVAILFIIVIALAGLGKVVVKALGGEEVKYPANGVLVTHDLNVSNDSQRLIIPNAISRSGLRFYNIPGKSGVMWSNGQGLTVAEDFVIRSKTPLTAQDLSDPTRRFMTRNRPNLVMVLLPPDAVRVMPGSSWGTFTIAATIPIALLVGFYMYRIRKGKTVEASIIGGTLTVGATVLGGWFAHSSFSHVFNLSGDQVTWAMAIYGFIAAVLPVWVLLAPRDYLSSFLKIGTIAVLVIGVVVANPKMQAPALNPAFFKGGPTVPGNIFPFLFITIMCGAISGFHALVSSGTTPKMLDKESQARTIGYGAMLIEGLVGIVAMTAAAALPVGDYYAMNTDLGDAPKWHDKFTQIGAGVDHLNVAEQRTQESLRGRTGGAVTLAVGMADIFSKALGGAEWLWKYWYHFAIMFEALFILTTIDAGTRIGRFLLQEACGKLIHPKLGETSWWPGAIVSTAIIVIGWAYFMQSGQFAAIWSMFGVANQMLAVIALAIVSAYLVREGKRRYLAVTLLPMFAVATTTTTAALELLTRNWTTISTQLANAAGTRDARLLTNATISATLIVAMLLCAYIVVIGALLKCRPPSRTQAQPGSGSVMDAPFAPSPAPS
jgi:carbon starvation protein